ncbi:P-II family nitrogen regulator [Paludibaculum fermentans]|uniref:P-II family nitrogen regulator n=1 Tax=Paludibaculum fermentans TaxID=1473598 RepID=A0A7S7NQ32_PALFE|nr:P-II family nitrogen regulator [Paludibaculum fermentans]QOY87702.1 P-II family nitrogen regulator [Paludibaculum fermentans]
MLKIEANIHPARLDDVQAALEQQGIVGVMMSQIMDHGGPDGPRAFYRGAEYRASTPRVRLEMLVSHERADDVVELLNRVARTGLGDDGIILIYEVADAVRIGRGEHLQYSLV